jgi:hypothetical protein
LWSRATITLAIHPRFKEEVAVRWSYGASAVRVETQAGQCLILPLDWTDLKPRAWLVERAGRTVHLAPDALRDLAAWVEARAACDRKVGPFEKCGESRGPDGEQRPSDEFTANELRPSRAADRPERRHPPAAALVEQARAPNAACRRHGGGEPKRGSR